MNCRWVVAPCVATVLLGGCATKTVAPDQAAESVVIRGYTSFYKKGPMQAGGPDASLPAETRVKVLRKEVGYSLVQLDDQRTGYVANEDLAPAPPRPQPTPAPTEPETRSGRKKRGSGSSRAFTGEQINDIPLPDRGTTPPDLNIGPEDVPAATPTPEGPIEKPKFRL